jgi:hypothetical protein
MDISIYRFLHVAAIIILFFAYGGLIQGAWTSQNRVFAHKRLFIILHGVGLLLLLISGFGQLARLYGHGSPWPTWVMIKVVVWVLLGVTLSAVLRRPQLNRYLWILVVGLGSAAAYLGVMKI